jgi:hypothetical protein
MRARHVAVLSIWLFFLGGTVFAATETAFPEDSAQFEAILRERLVLGMPISDAKSQMKLLGLSAHGLIAMLSLARRLPLI